MSEPATIADLFPADRHPTRELEPIQKVDRVDKIERDITEFHETPSARAVVDETATIIRGAGLSHRFRYVHATFGSGKSHLLKLIRVATGEMEGLEGYADTLANEISGFRAFREALDDAPVDHLHPLFMNLLDRDQSDTTLPLMLFEELGRRRGYPTTQPWLLELSWRLDIEHGLWDQLDDLVYRDLTVEDVIDRPSSLRPWLTQAIPELDGAAAAGLETADAVEEAIDAAAAAVATDEFRPNDLVERLFQTKQHLQEDGESHDFLIGLDEIAIYVGDQPRRYEEVVDTVSALIENLNPPILGTGQWSMRDMQRDFVGSVDDDAWYAKEIELEGADTEAIVRKRWLQKSDSGATYIEEELLDDAPPLDPDLGDAGGARDHTDPAEAYSFRDHDLYLLRTAMRGLIEGDQETDREYIQGRALLVRVRHLFDEYGWAEREPGAIVPWDELYDAIADDTALIPGWAEDLIERVDNTVADELAVRTAKALFLLSQVEDFPRTADNIARMLADSVTVDLDSQREAVKTHLDTLADENFIRADIDATPTTYTILSEEDIRFWQQVQEEATKVPEHQLRNNIRQMMQQVDSQGLTTPDVSQTGAFSGVENISYTVRYTIDQSLPDSVTDRYDTIVVRLLADGEDQLEQARDRWQELNADPDGREDVLLTVKLTTAIRQRVLRYLGMQSVLAGMADPDPQYELDRQALETEIEDELRARLEDGTLYTPTRSTAYGRYLDSFAEVMVEAVDEKFPNRKTIDRSPQFDDLQALVDFFNNDGGWPFTDADAERLGVNTVPRTIENGWIREFLDEFDDDDMVSGERVLETIEGRQGTFLGTPHQALSALLFVLVADNQIAVRRDGERVTDTRDVAGIITSRTQLEDAVIDFDPEPPAEDLDDVYAALLGEDPDTDDTRALLEDIEEWVAANGSTIRTVVDRTNLVFQSGITLTNLEDALDPAFTGDDLEPDLLTNETIVEEAQLFADVAPLFTTTTAETESLWDQFQAVYDIVSSLYADATEVKQMQPYANGTQVPDQDNIEDLIDKAAALRCERLQSLYRDLTGSDPPAENRVELQQALTQALTDTAPQDDIAAVEASYDRVDLADLQTLIDKAATADAPLSEARLADAAVQDEIDQLAAGRALLETESQEQSLRSRLDELRDQLDGDAAVQHQIEAAVTGANIPTVESARYLISQAEEVLAEGPSDGGEDDPEELWQRVTGYPEGTIVVIDTEGNR